MTKPCTRCGGPRNRPGFSRCRDCHLAYMKEWRSRQHTEEGRRKKRARAIAGVYKKRGKLVPQPCEVCGGDHTEMHHPDYHQPLLVVWLCRRHHSELHRAQRIAA